MDFIFDEVITISRFSHERRVLMCPISLLSDPDSSSVIRVQSQLFKNQEISLSFFFFFYKKKVVGKKLYFTSLAIEYFQYNKASNFG
jgi:hypothetical protein